MIDDDLTRITHNFGNVQIAMVERRLPNGFTVVNTQVLRLDEHPDWPALIAGVRESTDDLPEAS